MCGARVALLVIDWSYPPRTITPSNFSLSLSLSPSFCRLEVLAFFHSLSLSGGRKGCRSRAEIILAAFYRLLGKERERERCGNSRRFRAVIFARKKYRFHPSAFGSREFYWYVRSGCRAAVSQPPPINHYKYFGTGFPSVSPYRGYKLRRQRIPLSSRDDGSERHLFPQIYTAARKTFRSAVSNDRDG